MRHGPQNSAVRSYWIPKEIPRPKRVGSKYTEDRLLGFFDRLFKPRPLRTETHEEFGRITVFEPYWSMLVDVPPLGTTEVQGGGGGESPSRAEITSLREIRNRVAALVASSIAAL